MANLKGDLMPKSEMKTIKVSEAQGPVLDWLVAKAEGKKPGYEYTLFDPIIFVGDDEYGPSTNWSQGGPIIERECINLTYRHPNFTGLWTAFNDDWDDDKNGVNCGDTPLVAAMRCFVAVKLGATAEAPEELLQ